MGRAWRYGEEVAPAHRLGPQHDGMTLPLDEELGALEAGLHGPGTPLAPSSGLARTVRHSATMRDVMDE